MSVGINFKEINKKNGLKNVAVPKSLRWVAKMAHA